MKFKWSDQHIELEPANPSSEILRANSTTDEVCEVRQCWLMKPVCQHSITHWHLLDAISKK